MKQKIIPIVLALAVLVFLGIGGYYYIQYQKTKQILLAPSQGKDSQTQALINKVATLIELPQNETPTIATVSDVKKLSGQAFFAKAQNGDKVLIYSKSGKAILYRESINKIIDVSTLSIDVTNPSPVPVTSQASAAPISVTIYNGTATSGLAKSASQKVSAKFADDKISIGDSANSDYKETVVIDLSGKNSKAASDLASLLGGQVAASVPQGENKPNSDILIILGTDYTGN